MKVVLHSAAISSAHRKHQFKFFIYLDFLSNVRIVRRCIKTALSNKRMCPVCREFALPRQLRKIYLSTNNA